MPHTRIVDKVSDDDIGGRAFTGVLEIHRPRDDLARRYVGPVRLDLERDPRFISGDDTDDVIPVNELSIAVRPCRKIEVSRLSACQSGRQPG